MARSTRNAPPSIDQEQQEEMTVVVLRLKGGGDTLKKGFETLSAAFNSMGLTSQFAKNVNGVAPKQLNGTVLPSAEEESQDNSTDEAIDIEVTQPPSSSSPRTSIQRKPPTFLTDFDLNSGDVNWHEFATAKNPKTDNEKYLLAALWITEKGNVTDFSVNHVFTCFRAMKWNEQVDFSQPLRQMISKNSYFSHPSRKKWKLTQPGLHAARAVKNVGAA